MEKVSQLIVGFADDNNNCISQEKGKIPIVVRLLESAQKLAAC